MSSTTEGIPKMTTDCKELFSIFMKVGGSFISNFEYNTCTLQPQNITCNNLYEIKKKLYDFELAHIYYPTSDFIKYKYVDNFTTKPFICYDKQNIKIMQFDVNFEKDGRY